MKEFDIRLQYTETGRMIQTRLVAGSLQEAKIMARIVFRIDEGITKLIGVPKEVMKDG